MATTHYFLKQIETLLSCQILRFDIANVQRGIPIYFGLNGNGNLLQTTSPSSPSSPSSSSSPSPSRFAPPDRFTLLVPFCGKIQKWEILMDSNPENIAHPHPPDFIFAEGKEFLITLENYPKLYSRWSTSPISFFNVIADVLLAYTKEETKRVAAEMRSENPISLAFSAIQDIKGTECLLDIDDGRTEYRFLVPLDINLPQKLGDGSLVEKLSMLTTSNEEFEEISHQASARLSLLVVFTGGFYGSDKRTPEVRLVIPHGWRNTLSRPPKLPIFESYMSLIEYLPSVNILVSSYVDSIALRRKLFLAFQSCFGDPVEYDSLSYSNISFHFNDVKGIGVYLIHFVIPDGFPNEKPTIQLQSFSFIKDGFPISKDITTSISQKGIPYPYSPRWPPDEMVKRIGKYITEQLTEFAKAVK